MTGVKLIFALDGFLNSKLTVADWLGARLVMGTVRYGIPSTVPVALTSATPADREVNTI
jgi:hypothetical protein